jgi:hypothetical protein
MVPQIVNLSTAYPQVQKMLITVELLLGEIPERQLFRQAHMRKALLPYFQLTLGKSIIVDTHSDYTDN